MIDFKTVYDADKEYFSQDFSVMREFFAMLRNSLATGEDIDTSSLDLEQAVPFVSGYIVYVKLFQSGQRHIRFGSARSSLDDALKLCIMRLRANNNFANFDISNPDKCRIMLEFVIERTPVKVCDIHEKTFDEFRFEPGITGIELKSPKEQLYYLPTDAVIESGMTLNSALGSLARRTDIRNLTDKIPERVAELKKREEYEFFLLKSRAFVTYKDEALPLYRGNIIYNEFSYDTLISIFEKSSKWVMDNMLPDGRYLYYYDCAKDNQVDHEHPKRPPDRLYYNDLRHCGGIINILHAYRHTNNPEFLECAKKALMWSISILKEQITPWGTGHYAFYNSKAKLGGTGLVLAALMHYRIITKDRSLDKYIQGCTRHLLTRLTPEGEFLGYYIHPSYNDGKPLLELSDKERHETFSFYYPGEALLALALFANHFDRDKRLVEEVRCKSRIALDWIIDERPKIYAHLFTALPSDAWLMQAIEEWVEDPKFRKENWLNFVYTDAQTLLDKMYKNGDNPYFDYEGGYFYDHGNHYYPDGARSEGLIAAYYLAKKMGKEEFAQKILEGCKLAAKSQFQLFNSEKSNYAHLNPKKSKNTLRFKATRQWVRVDSFQHVNCFFIRLFRTEN